MFYFLELNCPHICVFVDYNTVITSAEIDAALRKTAWPARLAACRDLWCLVLALPTLFSRPSLSFVSSSSSSSSTPMLRNVALNDSGPMPPPAFKDNLPPLPPSDHFDNTPPPPPSKEATNSDHGHATGLRLPPIDTSATLSPHTGQCCP